MLTLHLLCLLLFFFFNDTATTEIYTLSLHDALPILVQARARAVGRRRRARRAALRAERRGPRGVAGGERALLTAGQIAPLEGNALAAVSRKNRAAGRRLRGGLFGYARGRAGAAARDSRQ